ncbi:MAG TPA: DNA-directed RNA polymerase subunit alpha, partial [Patescibacteria group bacterium]
MLDLAQIRVETLEEKDEKGIFVIEPLDPGFGHTIGNSLRRTLLSSLPGVAITQVKIDGVRHQFSTLSGLREDIIEFILNLKKVRVKSDSDKPVKLTLNVTGPKEVTAADIKASTGATIVNPKQVLAHLSAKAKFSAEMVAERGE